MLKINWAIKKNAYIYKIGIIIMEQIKLKQLIFKVLKTDDRLWSEDKTELNQTLLLDLVEKIDEKVIDLLLQEKELKEKFFVKIRDAYVFKTNDFRFFMEEHKLDNSYTAYKNKIGLTDGKKFLKDTNDVVIDFPYKDCVLEGGQSTEEGTDTYFEYDETVTKAQEKQGLQAKSYNQKTAKRKEIFFNSVLAHDEIDRLFDHKALTNWKRFTKDGEQEVKDIKRDEAGTIKENLIIKGNNLLALHSLKKQFAGKVKLIYIDPPYNTEKDSFRYNDNFTHSTWLTFMKNRLEIAKDLLSDDGGIYVQADWNEVHYLKLLMDQVFGRENFRNEIVWFYENKFKFEFTKNFNNDTEAILFYSKQKGSQFFKHVKVPVKNKRKQNKVTWDKEAKKMVTVKDETGNVIYYESNDKIVGTLWNIPRINSQSKERKDLLGQKPEALIERILLAGTVENDIVLDFFAGSGTTGTVAHKMKRQYIGIEQLDYLETMTIPRLLDVLNGKDISGITKKIKWQGGGDFIYFELAKWNATAKEKILEAKSLEELEKFFDEMYEKYFLNYNLKIKEFREKVIYEEEFHNLSLGEQKKMFIAMLDNNQMYVNKTEMADKNFGISKEDQNLTSEFYNSEK